MSFTIKEKIQMELFNIKKETMTVSLSYRVYHAQDFSDPGFQWNEYLTEFLRHFQFLIRLMYKTDKF